MRSSATAGQKGLPVPENGRFLGIYEAYRARGVRFVREPKEAPYGTVAAFEDLYGNLWDLVQFATA